MLRYEVQTYTLLDGWINTWGCDTGPATFGSVREAREAIDEFFDDLGGAGMVQDYNRDHYRVIACED